MKTKDPPAQLIDIGHGEDEGEHEVEIEAVVATNVPLLPGFFLKIAFATWEKRTLKNFQISQKIDIQNFSSFKWEKIRISH
jgi:hypothetical protein